MAAQTEAEKASAAEAKALVGKVVKYIGTSDVREIDAVAWKSIGIEDQHKVVWSRTNRWSVPVADLTKNALAYLDTDDDGFVVQDN